MSDKIQKLGLELELVQKIVESWHDGSVSELERDVVLEKLRHSYETIKFLEVGVTPSAVAKSEHTAAEPTQEVVVPKEPQMEQHTEEHAESDVTDEQDRQKMRRNALRSLYDSESVAGDGYEKKVETPPAMVEQVAIPVDIFDDLPSVDEQTDVATKSDDHRGLHKLIEINDRFLIVREVFDGDNGAYETAIDELEKYTDLDGAFLHIHEQYRWNPNSEGVKLLIDLLTRKLS